MPRPKALKKRRPSTKKAFDPNKAPGTLEKNFKASLVTLTEEELRRRDSEQAKAEAAKMSENKNRKQDVRGSLLGDLNAALSKRKVVQ